METKRNVSMKLYNTIFLDSVFLVETCSKRQTWAILSAASWQNSVGPSKFCTRCGSRQRTFNGNPKKDKQTWTYNRHIEFIFLFLWYATPWSVKHSKCTSTHNSNYEGVEGKTWAPLKAWTETLILYIWRRSTRMTRWQPPELSGCSRNDFYKQVFEWIFLDGLCQNENNCALDNLDLWHKHG